MPSESHALSRCGLQPFRLAPLLLQHQPYPNNTRRDAPYPYRPDLEDPWACGNSPVVDLPVSANLGGGDVKAQLGCLRDRLSRDGETDVFQSFWHHFEFAGLGWTRGTIGDVEAFLMACARLDNVIFSTAAEAAAALRKAGL